MRRADVSAVVARCTVAIEGCAHSLQNVFGISERIYVSLVISLLFPPILPSGVTGWQDPETRETAREYYRALESLCDKRVLSAMIPERDEVPYA